MRRWLIWVVDLTVREVPVTMADVKFTIWISRMLSPYAINYCPPETVRKIFPAISFKINAAVVTASDIGGKTPEEYASDYYNELYGGSNGVVFLVNDDTYPRFVPFCHFE